MNREAFEVIRPGPGAPTPNVSIAMRKGGEGSMMKRVAHGAA